MRLCSAFLIVVGLSGCTWHKPAAIVPCPVEPVSVEELPFPEYRGKKFDEQGVKQLLHAAEAAYDSRGIVIDSWYRGWDACN